MVVVKDAEVIAKETRGETFLSMNGYTRYLVTVNPLVNQ